MNKQCSPYRVTSSHTSVSTENAIYSSSQSSGPFTVSSRCSALSEDNAVKNEIEVTEISGFVPTVSLPNPLNNSQPAHDGSPSSITQKESPLTDTMDDTSSVALTEPKKSVVHPRGRRKRRKASSLSKTRKASTVSRRVTRNQSTHVESGHSQLIIETNEDTLDCSTNDEAMWHPKAAQSDLFTTSSRPHSFG